MKYGMEITHLINHPNGNSPQKVLKDIIWLFPKKIKFHHNKVFLLSYNLNLNYGLILHLPFP